MIKNISSSNQYITTGGGSTLPYIQYNPSNPIQGMLRINGSDMEVFDGNSWTKIYMTDANIGLNNTANSAIDWAIKKMAEEKEWAELAKSNDSVKIALENLEQARQQLTIIAKLAKDYEHTTS